MSYVIIVNPSYLSWYLSLLPIVLRNNATSLWDSTVAWVHKDVKFSVSLGS